MSSRGLQRRRQFLRTGVLGACGVAVHGATSARADDESKDRTVRVRFDELLPHQFRQRLAERPIAYLPLGTIEWHGEHLPLGSDAIQSEALMVQCARRIGGIVMPPIHLGPDRARLLDDGEMLQGMDYANTTTPPRALSGSCYWIPVGLHQMIVDAILTQLKRSGFKAVFADGHGPSRKSWADNMAERESRFGLKLFGVSQGIRREWRSQVDHAALNETSLVMHYRPELVDLSRLPASRDVWPQGVGGQDPRDATTEHGRECMESSLALMKKLFADAGLL